MKYDVPYTPGSTYARMHAFLHEHAAPGLVIDLGCGAGAIGGPLANDGFEYLGVDGDSDSVGHVRAGGHDAVQLDLSTLDEHIDVVVEAVAGRTVSAVIALDVLEHLPDPDRSFEAVRRLAVAVDSPLLGLSIPNVAHVDLATKLIAGRWDVTDMGLLDRTHLRFFTEHSLQTHLRAIGATEVARDDVVGQSDQYFPEGLPTISGATPLGHLLRCIRAMSDPNDRTIQFVRLYRLGIAEDARPSASTDRVTVVRRNESIDWTQVAADWVVLLDERHTLVDDPMLAIAELPPMFVGRAVRWNVRCAGVDGPRPGHVIDEIIGPHTRLAALALPGAAVRSGLLPMHADEHELVVRVVELLGVYDVDRTVVDDPSPAAPPVPSIAALDGRALVLPPGSASRLAALADAPAVAPRARFRRRRR